MSVRLSTPYASAAYAGVDYYLLSYQALNKEYPLISTTLVIDCGPYPGYAMAAMRAGAKYIYVDLKEGHVLQALQSMAKVIGAVILTPSDRPNHQLDLILLRGKDPQTLKQWLLKFKNSFDS